MEQRDKVRLRPLGFDATAFAFQLARRAVARGFLAFV